MKRSIFDSRFGMESALVAVIAGLTQLLALPQLAFFFEWSHDRENPSREMTTILALRTPVAIAIVIAIIVLGLVHFTSRINLALIASGFVLVALTGWFARFGYLHDADAEPSLEHVFWDDFGWQNVLLSVGNFLWLIALVLAILDYRARNRAY